ncbi:hypothetical protein C8A00DRAFT_39349 [Chaetomidium leptoderma]|uniref:Copper-fist domain-containing protein n=1 Tax=Chaetomidium leptoderma TaxID=669021 RepID=A0AAN6VV76_9PEZI|nr:hypothetical protein C8A00DRAFT_39349 [Chaetomidium leptoderma]
MPMINGQKMACAPCIRGHRSTKCNHFYERVMIPVRKPGRPLSTCPCPPGRSCSCGGVRVAIPKKQKCGCPSGDAIETDEHEKEHSPTEPPMSPSRPAFRVGKPNGGAKTSSRKQSFDPANLERMDPRSINLIAAASSNGVTNGTVMAGSPGLPGPQADLTGFGGPGLGGIPAGQSSAFASPQNPNFSPPMPYGMGFQYTQPPQLQHGVKLEDRLYTAPNENFGTAMQLPSFVNGSHAPPPLSSPAQPAVPIPKTNGGTTNGGSCCSSKAQKPSPPQNIATVPQPGYGQSYMPQPSGASNCCGSKAQKPAPVPNNNGPAPVPQSVFGQQQPYMPQFQYQTVFRYPGDYGSWQHPIDPIIWQQITSQTSMPLSTPMSPTTATNVETGDAGTSHQCSCGEGCQCVGCLAHPFNAQMYQYVNNAYNGSNDSSPGGPDPSAGGGGGGAVTAAARGGQDSPPEALTPAASEGSPAREEQSLSTMDYFFVNLPISGLCGGHLESCPCGDSCDCPGCLVHDIPLSRA